MIQSFQKVFACLQYTTVATLLATSGLASENVNSYAQEEKLDLLVVVDNSRSMRDERIHLSTKLQSLVSGLRHRDWRIAVVSTSDPCVFFNSGSGIRIENVVSKTDSDPEVKFKNIIQNLPEDSEALERGFPNAIQALQHVCLGSEKWTRDDSAVGVLVVSDEDNCSANDGSQEKNCAQLLGKTSLEFVQFLSEFRPGETPNSTTARVYGLLKTSPNSCPEASGVGKIYMEAISATNGIVGRICDADYSNTISKISFDFGK